jgi:hypothetical protein
MDKYIIYVKDCGPGHREIIVNHNVDIELTEANFIKGEEADLVFEAFIKEYEKIRNK